MSKKTKRILLILDLILVLGLAAGVLFYKKAADAGDTASLDPETLSARHTQSIQYEGQSYPLRRGLSAVLLIGTDNYVDDDRQMDFVTHYNMNLADFLVVLVIDHVGRTITPFQICRDTMCEVPWISVNGIEDGTEFQQITYAHSYGSGKEVSCLNTVKAVRNLLCGAPVDNYLAFTMDAVPLINDLVGGVEVRLEDDVPALGPEYVRGATLTLKGRDALRFVRYRDIELLDSNLARMARHRQYMTGFVDAARRAMAEDQDLAVKAFRAAEPFLCTDLSAENVSSLVSELAEYELLPAVTPEGEYVMGEEYAEFYVDEASLWECVRSVFCS